RLLSLRASLAQAHLDVAGRADVGADVASDAAVVVGVDVAAHRRLLLRHPLDRGLRAVNHAVVALEALSATHAALGLGDRLGLSERLDAFLEIAERALAAQRDEPALDPRRVAEVTEEQVLVRDHVALGAVVEVVDRALALVRAPGRLVDLAEFQPAFDVLAHQVEDVNVDLRAFADLLAGEELVDGVGGDRTVADRRRQQVRPDDVAAGEPPRLVLDLVAAVGVDGAASVVEGLEAGEVD